MVPNLLSENQIITKILIMQQQLSIWLDCDPGLDDALAIIYAAHHPQIKLVAISTSPGNTNLTNTTKNALDILYNIGRSDLDVYSGSNTIIQGEVSSAEIVHGQGGLGGVRIKQSPKKAFPDSFVEMYNKIMSLHEQIVWVNTGSLTNLCLLLMTFPQIKSKISKIVLMGGAIQTGNITPAAQFNIYCDPFAFERVLKVNGDIPLVMIPLQVTHIFLADEQAYNKFKSYSDHPFGLALYNMAKHYQQFYIQAQKWPFPPYHDPVTIYYLLHPEQFILQKALIEVDTGKTSKGRTNCYFKLTEQQQKQCSSYVTTKIKSPVAQFWHQINQAIQLIFSQQIQQKVN